MVEVDAGVAEDTDVEDMVVAIPMNVMDEEDAGEVSMVITHINLSKGTEYSQKGPCIPFRPIATSFIAKKNIIYEIEAFKRWRGFDVPTSGYKL